MSIQKTFQEQAPDFDSYPDDYADDLTVRTRKKVSALMAAFNALWVAADYDRICKEVGIDAGELRRMYQVIIELAMRAEEDAERQGHAPGVVRTFHITDVAAELCYRREFFPNDLTEEEKKKQRAALSRAWRRRYYRTIHAAQCRNHLPFVERTSGKIVNHKRVASVYVERMADTLAMIERTVDRNRGRVSRYNRAALAALNHLRQTAAPYAPDFDFNPEPKASEPILEESEMGPEAVDDPPYLAAIRRAVKLATKGMRTAPEEERQTRRLEQIEWLNTLWDVWSGDAAETENAGPPISSVGIRVDTQKDEGDRPAPEDVTKCAPAKSENCEIPAENDTLPEFSSDIGVTTKSHCSGVEYDPEPEPRGINLAEATAAADACASVGAEHVLVVWTDETLPVGENCVGTDEFESLAEFQENMPRLLSRNDRSPVESMAVRVRWKGETHLLQNDDCPPEALERLAPYSFMQIMTSPRNGQAWLAFSESFTQVQYNELKHRLFTRLNPTKDPKGVNGGAHGSVRWPGSLNRKPTRRYVDGESPRVQLLLACPGRTVTLAELDAAGLLAPAPPKKTREQIREIKGRLPDGWPSMDELLGKHKDRSTAEFAWSCRAIGAGWPQYRVEEELARIGAKACTRTRDNYVAETVAAAARKVGVGARTVRSPGALLEYAPGKYF